MPSSGLQTIFSPYLQVSLFHHGMETLEDKIDLEGARKKHQMLMLLFVFAISWVVILGVCIEL